MDSDNDPRTATLRSMETRLAEMAPGAERDSFEKIVKGLRARFEAYKAAHPDSFPDPATEKSLSPSAKRIRYLKKMNTASSVYTAADRENHSAVIAAYETGKLDLSERSVGEVALFWGGEMKRGWGGLGSDFEKGPPLWLAQNPKGRLWVEDVTLHIFHADPIRGALPFEMLDGTGSDRPLIFFDDMLNLINPDEHYPYWGNPMEVETANGVIERRCIWLQVEWRAPNGNPVAKKFWEILVVNDEMAS